MAAVLPNEKEIISRIASGDADAFAVFFEWYRDRLFLFVEQLIHSRADTEEIVQETFIKLWQSAPRLAEVDYPGQYVYTVARNRTLNYMRDRARSRQLVEQAFLLQSAADDSLEEKLRSAEVQELIDNSLSQLSGQKQQVFRLSRESGLTHEEIAARLGLSQSRVKNIIVEVLKHVRSSLDGPLAIIFWLEYGRHFF